MTQPRTLNVSYGDGVLAVRDHGGDGPAVLLVHALGMCSVNWDRVAPPLAATCRVLALDLPGHGQSSARMRTPYDVFESVLSVVRALDLGPTLLVGHDHGSLVVAEALTVAPELFCGGVAIGGSIARTREEMAVVCEVGASEFFQEAMRTRFGFGARGTGRAAAEQLLARVVARSSADWLLQDIDLLWHEREYSLRYLDDGSWIHQPDPADVAMVGRFPSDSPYFPTLERIPGFRVPVWIVQLSRGQDVQYAAREEQLVAEHNILRLIRMDCGHWPQYSNPRQLAQLLAAIAANPQAREDIWDDPLGRLVESPPR